MKPRGAHRLRAKTNHRICLLALALVLLSAAGLDAQARMSLSSQVSGSSDGSTKMLTANHSAVSPAVINALWAVNDGEKVDLDDLKNSHKAANSAWDGKRIKIFGARNEIVAFQLIIEAGSAGIGKLSVSLPELKQKDGRAKIVYAAPSVDPTQYVGRPIQLFSENYMHLSTPTAAGWIYKIDTPSAPKNPTGWKPVQLVPENAKPGKGGFPLKVEPLQNQAIWIELYLERNLPAGIYQGSVRVRADGEARQVPLQLELFEFTLPDEKSMQAMVYYESLQPELYQGRNLDGVYHRFAHRQGIELVHAYTQQAALRAQG